jgi:hypothetical protein
MRIFCVLIFMASMSSFAECDRVAAESLWNEIVQSAQSKGSRGQLRCSPRYKLSETVVNLISSKAAKVERYSFGQNGDDRYCHIQISVAGEYLSITANLTDSGACRDFEASQIMPAK